MRSGLVVALCLVPASVAAQSTVWAGYGQNVEQATGLPTGESVTLGYSTTALASGFSALVGIPVDGAGSSRFATLSGWFDHRLSDSPWGVTGGGTGFAFSDPVLETAGVGSILSLDGYIAARLAPVELRLRVGGRHGTYADAVGGSQRLLGRAGTEARAVYGMLDLRGELDHWRATEGGYTQAAARVGLFHPQIQAWAGLGRWLDAELPGTGWDVGARVPLPGRLALTARAGVQAEDILFGNPPQRSWAVGVQLRTGAAPQPPALPAPVLADDSRTLVVSLPVEDFAEPPGVAGTFSDWTTLPLRRIDDRWSLELVLEPGVHEYAFVSAAGEWFVPEGTPGRKPDGFGGHVAVVIVP